MAKDNGKDVSRHRLLQAQMMSAASKGRDVFIVPCLQRHNVINYLSYVVVAVSATIKRRSGHDHRDRKTTIEVTSQALATGLFTHPDPTERH